MTSTEPTPDPASDQPPYDPTDPANAAREAAARQRFFAIGLFRLSGAFIVGFGFAIMLEAFSWVSGDKAKMMGAIIATVGMVQWIFVPRLLKSAWRTPTP